MHRDNAVYKGLRPWAEEELQMKEPTVDSWHLQNSSGNCLSFNASGSVKFLETLTTT